MKKTILYLFGTYILGFVATMVGEQIVALIVCFNADKSICYNLPMFTAVFAILPVVFAVVAFLSGFLTEGKEKTLKLIYLLLAVLLGGAVSEFLILSTVGNSTLFPMEKLYLIPIAPAFAGSLAMFFLEKVKVDLSHPTL